MMNTKNIISKLLRRLPKLLTRESGQGMTEYAAIVAFVMIIAAFVFKTSQSSLQEGISRAFSGVASQLNQLGQGNG